MLRAGSGRLWTPRDVAPGGIAELDLDMLRELWEHAGLPAEAHPRAPELLLHLRTEVALPRANAIVRSHCFSGDWQEMDGGLDPGSGIWVGPPQGAPGDLHSPAMDLDDFARSFCLGLDHEVSRS